MGGVAPEGKPRSSCLIPSARQSCESTNSACTDYNVFHFLVLHDELSRVDAGPLTGLMGASAIGAPPILAYGTEAQKDAWLPGIFTGEHTFCLGATEPTGGSDLANLTTTAKKTADGKHYVVNGNKVSVPFAQCIYHE